MMSPETAAQKLADVFEVVHREHMAGLPLLNKRLHVETLGFQVYAGRLVGIVVTPWLMNLVMLPNADDAWDAPELGHKLPQEFPGGTYKFMVNEVDGLGRYLSHSIYSPMREFQNQNHALAAAEAFMRTLMTPATPSDEVPIDEELLGKVMRGEETPEIDLDAMEAAVGKTTGPGAVRGLDSIGVRVEERKISRRDLLRGRLSDT